MKKIITHNGKFHADEVLGVAIVQEIYPDAKVVRTRNIQHVDADTICIDVGGGEFDHHHQGFNEKRDNGDLYASAGLVWKKYGKQYIQTVANAEEIKLPEETVGQIQTKIDAQFIKYIDRHDNGVYPDQQLVGSTTFSALISSFNTVWYEDTLNEDEAFHEACKFAQQVLFNMVLGLLSEELAKEKVLSAIQQQNNPTILILEKGMPWKPFMKNDHNAVYVIHPDNNGKWVVLGVEGSEVNPVTNRRLLKKAFPESWGGLTDHHLASVTGVNDSIFCHKGRFIAVAKTQEGAIALAEKALSL